MLLKLERNSGNCAKKTKTDSKCFDVLLLSLETTQLLKLSSNAPDDKFAYVTYASALTICPNHPSGSAGLQIEGVHSAELLLLKLILTWKNKQ